MIHNFCINDFEGPLDLLLHLIRSSQMDIYDINIVEITKQYLDFIKESKEMSVDIASEYLVMAAELIHLKSKSLIKNDSKEDEELYEIADEEDLKNRLIEYENVKKITNSFSELEDMRSQFYTKIPSDLSEYRENSMFLEMDNNVQELIDAFQLFLSRQKLNKPLKTSITRRELSVSERTMQIRNIIHTKGKCEFTSLFEQITKPYVVVTFLSVLEMTKNREIIISQDKLYGDIILEPRKN